MSYSESKIEYGFIAANNNVDLVTLREKVKAALFDQKDPKFTADEETALHECGINRIWFSDGEYIYPTVKDLINAFYEFDLYKQPYNLSIPGIIEYVREYRFFSMLIRRLNKEQITPLLKNPDDVPYIRNYLSVCLPKELSALFKIDVDTPYEELSDLLSDLDALYITIQVQSYCQDTELAPLLIAERSMNEMVLFLDNTKEMDHEPMDYASILNKENYIDEDDTSFFINSMSFSDYRRTHEFDYHYEDDEDCELCISHADDFATDDEIDF